MSRTHNLLIPRSHSLYSNTINKTRSTDLSRSKSSRNSGGSKTSKNSKNSKTSKNSKGSKSSKTSKNSKSSKSSKSTKRDSNKHSKNLKNHHDNNNYDDDFNEHDNYNDHDNQEINARQIKSNKELEKIAENTKNKLKDMINKWMDYDDAIKTLNSKAKKVKDSKKIQEENILKLIDKIGVDDTKIDVHDKKNQNLRGRVCKHESVTKGALKEDIIRDALMETIRDERVVAQLVKKIDSKRPINKRIYLKRTKGNQ